MHRAMVAAAISAAVIVSGCTRLSDGLPTAGLDAQAPVSAPPPTSQAPTDDSDYPVPGLVATTQPPQPCAPPDPITAPVVAQVSDPGAPTVTIGVPDGWSMSPGGADPEGARLRGPEAMWASVTIAQTPLGPAAAFRQYEDDLTDDATVSTMSLLPGELCSYSGQRLMGILSDGHETVQYEDRIVHVPGSPQDYLIAVHVQAASGTPGFDEAASQLTADFEIGLP